MALPLRTPAVRGTAEEGGNISSSPSSALSSNMLISFFCCFGIFLLPSFFLVIEDDDDVEDFGGFPALGALGGFCVAADEVTAGGGSGIWSTTVRLFSSSPEDELLKRPGLCWEVDAED